MKDNCILISDIIELVSNFISCILADFLGLDIFFWKFFFLFLWLIFVKIYSISSGSPIRRTCSSCSYKNSFVDCKTALVLIKKIVLLPLECYQMVDLELLTWNLILNLLLSYVFYSLKNCHRFDYSIVSICRRI